MDILIDLNRKARAGLFSEDMIGREPYSSAVEEIQRLRDSERRLRDDFAMAAITGFLADEGVDTLHTFVSKYAYELADAMMEARKLKEDL